MSDSVEKDTGHHDGVLYGIRHPGPAEGCPYCEDTLRQRHLIDSWESKTTRPIPPESSKP